MKYEIVRIDKKRWASGVTAEDVVARGYTVKESRLNGDKSVFCNGRLVAYLFASKIAAAKFVSK